MSDRYGYIAIETLLDFCENSKDHAVTPNDFMRMARVREPERKPGRWTPCSERLLEEKSDWKNVTVFDESGDTTFAHSSVGYYLNDGMWIVDNEPMDEDASIRVTAWMPLPEPYKGGD